MKPRLTRKVLEGLAWMAARIDPDHANSEVRSAIKWVTDMQRHRHDRQAELALVRQNPSWMSDTP
jgi:hypothetical protein